MKVIKRTINKFTCAAFKKKNAQRQCYERNLVSTAVGHAGARVRNSAPTHFTRTTHNYHLNELTLTIATFTSDPSKYLILLNKNIHFLYHGALVRQPCNTGVKRKEKEHTQLRTVFCAANIMAVFLFYHTPYFWHGRFRCYRYGLCTCTWLLQTHAESTMPRIPNRDKFN